MYFHGSELQPLHPLHRVARLVIGQGVLLEGISDLADCISHAVRRLEAGGQQLAGILPIGTGIVGGAHHDLGADLALDSFGDIENRDVFKTGVVAATRDLRMGQEVAIYIGNILNMDVGPGLIATEDGDAAILERLMAEHVYAHIQPHAWRQAAYGGRADAVHMHLILVGEEHPLGDHLSFVVDGDRHKGEVFGDVRLVLHSIHTAGTGENKLFYPSPYSPIGQLLAGQHVHLPAECGVELHRRVVGNVGQVNDRLHALQGNRVGVADVELEVGEIGVLRQVVAEPLGVDTHHLIAIGQQQRNQYRTFVAAATGDQKFHALC